MEVRIIAFPQTEAAGTSHLGHPSREHETVRKLVAWKLEHKLLDPVRYRAYKYLFREWLPRSGEKVADLPVVFHYVNVGPTVQEHEAITDVYLPLA